MLGLSGDHVLLVEDGFGLGVIELKRGVDLATAFDGLLVEFVGAALVAIEVRLEMIADVEEQLMAPMVSALAVMRSRSPSPQSAEPPFRRERHASPRSR